MRDDIELFAGEQDDEWLEQRIGMFTASEINKLLTKGRGNAPSKTRARYIDDILFEIETGIRARPNIQSYYMEFGKKAEPFIRKLFESITGYKVMRVGLVTHTEIERFGASPDGVIIEDDANLEIKTTVEDYFEKLWDGGAIKKEHQVQMQAAMMCTGASRCHYVVMDSSGPYLIHRIVPADKEIQSKIEEEVKRAHEEIRKKI